MNKFSIFCFIYLFSFFLNNPCIAQTLSEINNKRSDTINVLNYQIKIDFTQMSAHIIKAACKINFKSKMNNVSGISLDLLKLTIDSIQSNGINLSYNYNDTLLRVQLGSSLSAGAMDSLTVYYQGTPQTDPSNFGGFYFNGDYAYNMGVGMTAKPHNFGRVWYPCFDNFVERASYEVQITAPQDFYGFSNGYILSQSTGTNNENITTWRLEDSIPSYLACVSVAKYTTVSKLYHSSLTNTDIPILLIAEPQDTTNLKNSFVHLPNAIATYEQVYGPYRWNKIGYCIVPFTGGAMEHATCIMYPEETVNGSLTYETMMAHELSHHWWGDLVTCKTAEDMWINEGIASYNEDLFLKNLYGNKRYIQDLKYKHKIVLQHAAFDDGGFYPLSGIPPHATYGTTTYQKGATMMHNLRTYMGDSDFFNGLRSIIDNYAFQSIDATEFRNQLASATGFDATEFFKDYIFNPGTNGFELDSFHVVASGGSYNVKVYIQQKLFHAPNLFNNVPLEITLMDANRQTYTLTKLVSGEQSVLTFSSPIVPELIYFNKDSKLLNAVTAEDSLVTGPVNINFAYAYFHVNVTQENDTSFLRVEHLRIPPDPIIDAPEKFEYVVSPDRYWKVSGIWSNSFKATARFTYDASNTINGNLDNGLMQNHAGIAFNEDSLVLLWRPNEKTSWKAFPSNAYTIYVGNATDASGVVWIDTLKKGEYTLGFKKSVASLLSQKKNNALNLFPNPTSSVINISWNPSSNVEAILLLDNQGKLLKKLKVKGNKATLLVKKLPAGLYFIQCMYKGRKVLTQKFIKQ